MNGDHEGNQHFLLPEANHPTKIRDVNIQCQWERERESKRDHIGSSGCFIRRNGQWGEKKLLYVVVGTYNAMDHWKANDTPFFCLPHVYGRLPTRSSMSTSHQMLSRNNGLAMPPWDELNNSACRGQRMRKKKKKSSYWLLVFIQYRFE